MLGEALLWQLSTIVLAIVALISSGVGVGLIFEQLRRKELLVHAREQRLPEATKLENLTSQIAELESELLGLKDRLADAREEIEHAQRERQWMESAREEKARMEADLLEVRRVQNELETAQNELAVRRGELTKVADDLDNLKKALADLEARNTECQKLIKEAGEIDAKVAQKRQELELAESQVRQKSEEIKELDARAARLRTKYEDELRAIRKETDLLEEAEKHKKAKINELDEELASLRNLQKESQAKKDDLEQQIQQLTGQQKSLSAQIPVLQATWEKLSNALPAGQGNDDKNSDSDLWKPAIQVSSNKSKSFSDEREALAAVEAGLKGQGLLFSQRTLYAFHTSLKSTLGSPLVTLAGVSGTGKSELPRQYAKLMGINFLGIAVQPRWDSPQDLFGFFDYLEGRFRPTELTRALLQMDPIGTSTGRGWTKSVDFENARLPNQVLMVLLDEMNLARVEYYFSEFLSKLETRRNVSKDDEATRRQAEIVLDVGNRGTQRELLRLFVDKNVLFVGTMNEDESTQSLSDKVIDRSNILRFGTPKSLSTPKGNPSDAEPGRLSADTWSRWCRNYQQQLSGAEREQSLSRIQTLSGALKSIGRPFAYRVAQAMLEYIANYPHPDRYNQAFADQIEQRILPKLNGLDLQNTHAKKAIESVLKVVSELDDEELGAQIAACRKEHDYFQWLGMDRT